MPQHDHAERRRGVRSGRMRGCYVYLTAGTLRRAGIDTEGLPPFYRTWAAERGRVVIQLYKER